MTEIPPVLIEQIRRGQTVLFLGAGASFGATGSNDNPALSGAELASSLSDEFLQGQYKDRNLATVAELAISESDIRTVQDYIVDLFRDLRPAPFHLQIPTFRWHGLVTTNFDRLIEAAFEQQENRTQKLATFLSNQDRVEDATRSPDHVLMIKLHGCITRAGDPNLPLILTPDQYITHQQGREYLFDLFSQWAKEKTVVFVGQDLTDSDLRAALLTLEARLGPARPHYYLVRPNVTEPEKRLWAQRRVDVLNLRFEDFIGQLDHAIPQNVRPLLSTIRSGHPISHWFTRHSDVPSTLADALEADMLYVHAGMRTEGGTPLEFYKGFDLGWYPVVEELDVRRSLTDRILLDVVLKDESERPSVAELYVLKGPAGSGKTVLLRRLAWETAIEAERLAIYVQTYRSLDTQAIRELANLTTGNRIFLFIDDLADHVRELDDFITEARRRKLPITVIGAESSSQWEIYCDRLNDIVNETFPVRALSEDEIGVLVDLLALHDSLGTRLERMTRDERIAEFAGPAGRQLLVALHEATMGEPLEVIVEREFRSLQPKAAQELYMTVCVLNRLNVPVRAGLISRVHGIPFDQFKNELLGPLDHVVKAALDPIVKDYMYRTRHPEIADWVFRRVLTEQNQRFREFVAIIDNLNIAYKTDEIAFNGMVKGRNVVELFSDYQMANEFYKRAGEVAPTSSELFHQWAIYEMRRPNPSSEKAYELLERAWDLDRNNTAVTHSFAELALVQADSTESLLKKEKFWERAEGLAASLLDRRNSDRYARHTLVKAGLARLRAAISEGQPARVLEGLIATVEKHLERGYQANPHDPYLTNSEADLLELLQESDEALTALKKGWDANPGDRYMASRLARAYESRDRLDDALTVVETALKHRRSDRQLNYRKGLLLRKQGESDPALLLYFFRRAFTPGDNNYDAQFWYARYCYEEGSTELRVESKSIFRKLRDAAMPLEARTKIRDESVGDGRKISFSGRIVRLDSSYGFVEVDDDDNWIFMHKDDNDESVWEMLAVGSRVSFYRGFTMKGPVAFEIQIQ